MDTTKTAAPDPPAPKETAKPETQPELDLKPPQAKADAVAPNAPPPPAVAPAAQVTSGGLFGGGGAPGNEPPKPEAPKVEAPPAAAQKIDPDELRALATNYEALKKDHDALHDRIQAAQKDRRLQVIRAAGVEALADHEIHQLAPAVDPDTTEGRQKINEWIEAHPALVSPRYRAQAPKSKEIAATAIENPAVKTLFGDAETVRSRIQSIFGGER